MSRHKGKLIGAYVSEGAAEAIESVAKAAGESRSGLLRGALAKRLQEASGGETGRTILWKAADEMYSFGPVRSPGDEGDAEEVRKAGWSAFTGDCEVRDGDGRTLGHVVEMAQWPYEHGGFPAGTTYAGVKWTPDGWADVQKGKVTGVSLDADGLRVVS